MIVDASVILSVLFAEPDARQLAGVLSSDKKPRIPAPTFFEAILATRRLPDPIKARAAFDKVVSDMRLIVADFTPEHAEAARDAYVRYGKGSGHPAQLNFGDCLVYGFAKVEGEPLLFKGDDFSQTDIAVALAA